MKYNESLKTKWVRWEGYWRGKKINWERIYKIIEKSKDERKKERGKINWFMIIIFNLLILI